MMADEMVVMLAALRAASRAATTAAKTVASMEVKRAGTKAA